MEEDKEDIQEEMKLHMEVLVAADVVDMLEAAIEQHQVMGLLELLILVVAVVVEEMVIPNKVVRQVDQV